MKIGQLENKAAAPPAATERKASPSGGKGAEPSAKVELSSQALLSSAAADPVFDAAKVKRIADAIRDGKYEINPGVIADKLIANAQELLGNGKKV